MATTRMRVGDSVQGGPKLFREARSYTWIAFCVPCRGFFGLRDGGQLELKGLHDGRLPLRKCGAELQAKGSG